MQHSTVIYSNAAKNGTRSVDTFERAPGCLDPRRHHTGILPEYEHQSKCTVAHMALVQGGRRSRCWHPFFITFEGTTRTQIQFRYFWGTPFGCVVSCAGPIWYIAHSPWLISMGAGVTGNNTTGPGSVLLSMLFGAYPRTLGHSWWQWTCGTVTSSTIDIICIQMRPYSLSTFWSKIRITPWTLF